MHAREAVRLAGLGAEKLKSAKQRFCPFCPMRGTIFALNECNKGEARIHWAFDRSQDFDNCNLQNV